MTHNWHFGIYEYVHAVDVARISMVCRQYRDRASELKEIWLEGRDFPADSSLEKIHTEDVSVFSSQFKWQGWKHGPNIDGIEGNTVAFLPAKEGHAQRVELSAGTDWSGFQGIYSTFEKCYPSSLRFTVSVEDPNVCGGSVVLASGVYNWGMCDIYFHCKVDNGQWMIQLSKLHWINICPAKANQDIDVQVHFDWEKRKQRIIMGHHSKTIPLFRRSAKTEKSDAAKGKLSPVGCIAFYNWRNRSTSRFSNVVVCRGHQVEVLRTTEGPWYSIDKAVMALLMLSIKTLAIEKMHLVVAGTIMSSVTMVGIGILLSQILPL